MDNPAFENEGIGSISDNGVPKSGIQLNVLDLPADTTELHNTVRELNGGEKDSKQLFLPFNGNGVSKSDEKSPTETESGQYADTDIDDIVCGIGPFVPACLQGCATIGYFTAIYSLCGIVTSGLNVYMNSQITTLEKHFNFNSSVSGLLMSCNDLGYLLTTLIMSYYTRRVHIPRGLALSTTIFGLSGLVCTLAYFGTSSQLTSPSEYDTVEGEKSFAQMCINTSTTNLWSSNATCEQLSERTLHATEITTSWKTLALCMLAFGMLVQGMAKSPRHPFLGTYVDDNVPKTKTSMYLGITIGFAIFGPALAFVLGGIFSRVYVTLEESDLDFRDPRWIGAWWLGFLVFGLGGLIVAIPLYLFPRRLKGHRQLDGVHNLEKDVDQLEKKKKTEAVVSDVKGFFQTIRRLVTNPVYVLITLATGVNLMSISGMMAFMPKYLETQFTVPVWKANMILGSTNVFAASIGTIVGGFIVAKRKLTPVACLRFIFVLTILSVLFSSLGFVIGCKNPEFETGTLYTSNGTSVGPCSSACNCDSQNFFPVCGADNRNYFSPCHAGCTATQGSKTFIHCSCVFDGKQNTPAALSDISRYQSENGSLTTTSTAQAGLCEPECSNFYPYVIVMFFSAFCATISIMPNFVAYVRSVSESDKPLAIGLMAFCGTLIGWFPGPVIFGLIIDTTCQIWKTSCDSVGACVMYDLDTFRFRYHGAMVALRVVNILLLIAVQLIIAFSKTFKFQSHADDVAVVAEKEVKQAQIEVSGLKETEASCNNLEL